MEHGINWKDTYFSSSSRKVYTQNELNIPALVTFAKHTMNHAVPPLPDHFHENCFELTLVTSGSISFTVGKKQYDLSGSDVFLTFPSEVHSTNFLPLSAGEIIWFQLDISDPTKCFFLNEEASLDLFAKLQQLQHHTIHTKNTKIVEYIKEAFSLTVQPENKFLIAQYLTLALTKLVSLDDTTTEVTDDIQEVLYYIQKNITTPLMLDELADVAGLSTSQFKQKFRLQTGMTPRYYVNLQKIGVAKKLLAEGNSITHTAMELGFDTSSYFAVVFKRYLACTPKEYQKRHLQKDEIH
ncbi:AraC family transcriptional regulator [Chakrabartyella piscis]|uniref:AraC family transcriptional regulator n=1 Tax=Chakrabartyella piscis TaxID=2918914 RepID=UPI0029589772|nr:AraC family transcriptional regulator [Chakrabartyella piscis]